MMRRADSETIEKYGIDGIILMENAAAAIENAVMDYLSLNKTGMRVLALCGKGNNGGDGFAAARRLVQRGLDVTAAFFDDAMQLKGDCKKNYEIYKNLGGKFVFDIEELEKSIDCYDVVIDALYGFGFHGELEGCDRKIAEIINDSDAYVVAADMPSGVCADEGKCSVCINADETVTFTGYKPAHLQFDAAAVCGKVKVADIGIPKVVCDKFGIGETIEMDFAKKMLPYRGRNAHKGTCGKVFVVGGSRGMSGAVCMSAMSAVRSGAGLVTAGVPQGINDVFEKKVTEAMSIALAEDENGGFAIEACKEIIEFAHKCDTIIIGPGMGRGAGAEYIVRECIKNYDKKLVIDADALYVLSKDVSMLDGAKCDIIITPHYAEMARLTGYDVKYIENNSIECAREFAKNHDVTVVLKGAYTVIASGESVYVNNGAGNPGMATGGSGDVLSGVIGALSGIGDSMAVSAALGVYIHALAGDIAGDCFGEEAMCATDIMNSLGEAFKAIKGT